MGTVSRCGPASLGAGEQHAEGRMRPPAGWKKRELLPPWEYPPEAFPFPFGKDERNTVHLLCRRVPVPPQPSPQPPESGELRRGESANQEPRPGGSQDSSWWGPPHPHTTPYGWGAPTSLEGGACLRGHHSENTQSKGCSGLACHGFGSMPLPGSKPPPACDLRVEGKILLPSRSCGPRGGNFHRA